VRNRPLLLTYAIGPLAALGLVWLQEHGLVADTPYWILFTILCSTSLLNYGALVLGRRTSPMVRMHLRLGVSAGTTAAVVYAAGWGSLLTIAFAVGVADVLRTEGSPAWLPGLEWSTLALALGELAVAFDIAPSIVAKGPSHAIAVGGVVCLGVVLHTLGSYASEAEVSRDQIRRDREQFQDLVLHAADVIALVGSDGKIRYVTPAVEPMLGYPATECVGREMGELMDPADRIAFDSYCDQLVPLQPLPCELAFVHRSGAPRLVAMTITQRDDDTRVVNLHDVTRQRELELQLRRQATIDSLTGLPNRHALMERLELMRRDSQVTVFFIDLDGFKEVNDEFGHERGDAVLAEAAARIAGSLPADTAVGRLGGDEFLAFNADTEPERAVAIASGILASLDTSWPDLEGRHIGASIGIARSSDGETLDALIHRADAAMYAAKCDDGGRIVAAT
jgi:diguanylate cyclase (GGDEF)-like protein/PAS domain S-box-containing protein